MVNVTGMLRQWRRHPEKERIRSTGFFNDTSIDPETGALLGRYIAEERDSGRRLQAAYSAVLEKANGQPEGHLQNGEAQQSELKELRAAIKSLKKEVQGAQAAAVGASAVKGASESRGSYRPLNRGSRFSRKACTLSFESSV